MSTMSTRARWTVGILAFTVAFSSWVVFDRPTSLRTGLFAVLGGLVLGFLIGTVGRRYVFPADTQPRPWHGVATTIGLLCGFALGSRLRSGVGTGIFLSVLGGLIASMAYFSPKLRETAR
jgi:NhaP-type Na+/H+ or K+/H+ antiporter